MSPEPFDPTRFIRSLMGQGWHWSEADAHLLVHPADYDLSVRYDPATGRLTVSPRLEEQLKLVIPTPASKSRTWR